MLAAVLALALPLALRLARALDALTLARTARQPGPGAAAHAAGAGRRAGAGHRLRGLAGRPRGLRRARGAAPGAAAARRRRTATAAGERALPAARCCWRPTCWRAGCIAPQELPVGVFTALLGGGYLLWLLHRGAATTVSAPRLRRAALRVALGGRAGAPRRRLALAPALDRDRRPQRRRQVDAAARAGRPARPAAACAARRPRAEPGRARARRRIAWLAQQAEASGEPDGARASCARPAAAPGTVRRARAGRRRRGRRRDGGHRVRPGRAPAGRLSGGERQRVLLARALAVRRAGAAARRADRPTSTRRTRSRWCACCAGGRAGTPWSACCTTCRWRCTPTACWCWPRAAWRPRRAATTPRCTPRWSRFDGACASSAPWQPWPADLGSPGPRPGD